MGHHGLDYIIKESFKTMKKMQDDDIVDNRNILSFR